MFKCLHVYIIKIRKIVPTYLSCFNLNLNKHLNKHYSVSGSICAFAESYFMHYFKSGKTRIKLWSCMLPLRSNRCSWPYKVDWKRFKTCQFFTVSPFWQDYLDRIHVTVWNFFSIRGFNHGSRGNSCYLLKGNPWNSHTFSYVGYQPYIV